MIFDFPERFRYLRQSKNLAQSQLANLIGVDRSTISSYESNIRQPSLDTLSRIADVFGVSTDYLLGRTDSLGFDSLALNGEEKALVYKLAFALSKKNLQLRQLQEEGYPMPEPICSPEHDTWEKRFIPAKPKTTLRNRLFRVCAYCRVSTGNDAQLSSFELQQAHYRQLADQRPNWSLRHIYADEGISGVSLKNRTAFNDMIAACEKGEYDLIVTKSVSRFARNLVDCISLVRRLKNLDPPVGVFLKRII